MHVAIAYSCHSGAFYVDLIKCDVETVKKGLFMPETLYIAQIHPSLEKNWLWIREL